MGPQSIGDYVITKQIGQGSLGTVYLAEHRFLKKHFAIKVLPDELSSERGFVQRLEKEVVHLATLDHPHIVPIHNICHADGYYFLVTDCIVDSLGETTNLAQYLSSKAGPLKEEEIVKIVHQVASALDYAHQKQMGDEQMVHRCLKLNNILIGKDGLNVHLSDFGLSRIVGTGAVLSRTYKVLADALSIAISGKGAQDKYVATGEAPNKLSKLHHSFLQNFAFLAPEQKVISEQPITAKADIYAFGVLVYYLIMRKFPEGFFELPSKRFKDYQLNWDLLIYRCLQTDPEMRPSSLKEALEELLAQGPASSMQEMVHDWKEPAKTPAPAAGPKPVLKPQVLVRPEYEPDPGAIFQTESAIGRYQPKSEEAKEVDPLLTEMIVIPGGSFLRGSNNGGRDEMPRHVVNLSSFALDIHPVTNEQFVRFLEAMGGEKDSNNNDIIRLRESRIKRSGGKLNIESGYARHPVVGITWYGAVAYAKWVGKRLPTEAEWEVSACGGLEDCLYPTGNNIERSHANFFSSDTTSVQSYPPNSIGLYDMAGNVYEWCQDWYDFHYYDISVQEPDDPKGPHQGVYRVLRGGCWKSLKEDLRCAHRHRNNPGTMNGTYGFRCAADVL